MKKLILAITLFSCGKAKTAEAMRSLRAIAGIVPLLAVLSCSPLKHYKSVAKDSQRNEDKRAILAPICAEEFPNMPSRDSSVITTEEYKKGNTVPGTFILNPNSNIKYEVVCMAVRVDTIKTIVKTTVKTKEIDSAYSKTLELDLKKAFKQIDIYSTDLLKTKLERDELKKGKENIGTLLLWLWQAVRWWLLAFMVLIIIYKTQNIWLKALSWIK